MKIIQYFALAALIALPHVVYDLVFDIPWGLDFVEVYDCLFGL